MMNAVNMALIENWYINYICFYTGYMQNSLSFHVSRSNSEESVFCFRMWSGSCNSLTVLHPTEGQVGKSLLVKSLCLICAVWPGFYVLGTSAE